MTAREVLEIRACNAIGISRSTLRYIPVDNAKDDKLRSQVIELSSMYGRYGYRKITEMLNNQGISVGKDKVYRIWREEGLKVPIKQPKRARLWLNDGSCIRQRPENKNHVWSYDFVSDKTYSDQPIKILNIIDEYSRECLTSFVAGRIRSSDIVFVLADLFLKHGVPKHIRSDNSPEFVAKKLISWFKVLGISPLFITPASPWENGYCESFNGKVRYELLHGEIFYTVKEARTVITEWVKHYNTVRPHSALGGKPPAPETVKPRLDLVA